MKMRTGPVFGPLLVLAILAAQAFAGDGAASDAGEVETVRVIGNLADGTPPPPAPPRELPELTVLDTFVHPKGERSLIIQKVLPPDLPEPPQPPPAPALSEEELQALFAQARERIIETRFAFVSATVYDHEKTLVRWWIPADRERDLEPRNFEAWSNIDFLHLTGFGSFEYEGITYSLLMAAGAIDTEAWRERMASSGRELELPESPELPADRPAYVVTEGDATDAEGTAIMDGLHALYAKEKDRLVAAYEGRERARKEREAWLLAHPPQPLDTVLRYSFSTRPLPQANKEGGAK